MVLAVLKLVGCKAWCWWGSSTTGGTAVSSSFKFPAWDIFLWGLELLWHFSWLKMPCPCYVMKRKGRDLPWPGA